MDWFDELGTTLAMGTRALDGPLFVRDDDFARDLAWKAELLRDRHTDVFGSLDTPAVRAASSEVLALTGGAAAAGMHALEAAARAVQEDLCVLVLRDGVEGTGAPHLDAACLCFPSYWRLADKLGHPLDVVHGPVPRYGVELAAKVDAFLRRLKPGRMVWRRNWSIHDDPSYFLPDAGPPRADLVAPDDLYLRSERQVLRRLETPDTVLFTIRTQQVPLATLDAHPETARRLAAIIAGWSYEIRAYKGGHGATAAHDWLATRG